MSVSTWLPLLVVSSSAVPGVLIFLLPERLHGTRTLLNLGGALLKIAFVAAMLRGEVRGETYAFAFALAPGFDFLLRADSLGMLFVTLSAVLWLLTTVYAIGYLEKDPRRSRFFGFFSLCVSATTGVALAGNLLTFLVFYETLTLSTYPLVVHRGDAESLRAGRRYLAYTLSGGAGLLLATAWLQSRVGPVVFEHGGALFRGNESGDELAVVFVLFVASLGVKSALVPFHSWLPAAMVAPAPVSALLHAVAVVKAGAFGIVRVVYEIFGIRLAASLGVLTPLAVLASVTIVYGSVQALLQTDIKRRLAYSTVSQVSYIILGSAILGPLATLGALSHLVHQGVMKITLFFCAGIFSSTLGVHKVSELAGVGKRLPLTSLAFTVAALGMIGLPPLAGFITKWHLGIGAAAARQEWVIAVLLASTVLNAAYFLPLLHAVWFDVRDDPFPGTASSRKSEAHPWLLWPALVTAALTVFFGVFAASSVSVQAFAGRIVNEAYTP